MSADDLYETDFVAWTERQAEAIRSLRGASNALDVDNLVEEIESLGRFEIKECESYVRLVLAHLLKLAYGPEQPARGWTDEIIGWRGDIESSGTGGVLRRVDVQRAWRRALREARASLALYGDPTPPKTMDCPFTLADVLPDGPSVDDLLTRIDRAAEKKADE